MCRTLSSGATSALLLALVPLLPQPASKDTIIRHANKRAVIFFIVSSSIILILRPYFALPPLSAVERVAHFVFVVVFLIVHNNIGFCKPNY